MLITAVECQIYRCPEYKLLVNFLVKVGQLSKFVIIIAEIEKLKKLKNVLLVRTFLVTRKQNVKTVPNLTVV